MYLKSVSFVWICNFAL